MNQAQPTPKRGQVSILRADARQIPLPDESVDLIVTSPPYYALRSYTDGGEHYAGQIGDEPTPQEYIANLIDCTREWIRVLKPTGSLFIDLGDKYSGAQAQNVDGTNRARNSARTWRQTDPGRTGIPNKSLMLLPERYRIAAVDELGLIARAVVVWSKTNCMPESVTDRVRRSHEDWVHLTKQPRYFSAIDEIREPSSGYSRPGRAARKTPSGQRPRAMADACNALGRQPGSVWEIPTEPLQVPAELGVKHFAAFSTEWPRRIVLGWSPSTVCDDCGFLLGSTYDSGMLGVRGRVRSSRSTGPARKVLLQGMREPAHRPQQEEHHLPATDDPRVRRGVEAGAPDGTEEWVPDGAPAGDGRAPGQDAAPVGGCAPQERDQDGQPDRELGATDQGRARQAPESRAQAVPVPSLRRHAPDLRDALACPHCGSARLEPARIVDPFGGTGTTALVASVLGRHGISVDRSADYCRLACWRTSDPGQLAKAMRVPAPPRQIDGQGDLLQTLGVAS